MRTVKPLEDEVIGGKYFISKDTSIVLNNVMVQRDPRVWGDDVCRDLNNLFRSLADLC